MDAPPAHADYPENWTAALYDDLLADVMLRRDDVAAELAFLTETLRLRPGMRVLDQGCGIGSLALPLAATGIALFGIDQAAGYVAEARAEAARRNVDATFVCGDTARIVPPAPVHGAFSWWTSWGHAAACEDNLATLRRAFDALVPGGLFALDTMNVCGVLRGFAAETTLRRTVPRLGGAVTLHRTSRVDLPSGLLHKVWTFRLPDGSEVQRLSAMRLYLPWQVAAMLAAAGFVDIRLLGSMAGEPLAMDSGRLIAVARRP